ncbi:MAG: hypothetical protein D6759_19710 [Chloroflexi bacterium]|nr:MAG: hypothetical protein D6759_19710 [Chloroflexota bacterium]
MAVEQTREATVKERLLDRLLETARALPEEKLSAVVDFADYLQHQQRRRKPERGSAEAILQHAGKFQFEPGELDRLLAEIEQMREMDLEDHDRLSA